MAGGPFRALRLAAGAVVAIAVLAAFTLSGSAHATQYRQVYLQFNLCGNACNSGGLAVVTALASAVAQRAPFAITLNEVCENQYARLRADLVRYDGRFDPTGPTCRNGARYGNVVLVRAVGVDRVGSWRLPNPAADETRGLMCVRTRSPGVAPLTVCVTHISNESGNIAAQVSAVAAILSGLPGPILLGGDFNTDPADARMAPLYGTCGGSGAFREADEGGCANRTVVKASVGPGVVNRDTYPRHKFDYIFLSDGGWSSSVADVSDAAGGLSDHYALWATTTR